MATTSHTAKRPSSRKTPAVHRHVNAVPTTLSLDPDAKQLLREMTTNGTMGSFVSGLIRAEMARREERARLRRVQKEASNVQP